MSEISHSQTPPPSTSSGQAFHPLTPSDIQPLPPPPAERDPPDGALVPVRERIDGWTAARQRAFIEHLADHGCAKSAAEAVGMSEQSAHRLRRRPDAAAFDAAWLGALRSNFDMLMETAADRAVRGAKRSKMNTPQRSLHRVS